LHFKGLRRYPASPKTLGEHLRKKRIDLSMSMAQLAKLLGVGMTKTAIEKWENNQNHPTPTNRIRIIEFLGFDPELSNPTGDHS
jgi:transcriptional regulator with XRE-family HTH domain